MGTVRYLPETAEKLIVRSLDDITLIYHRPSGQTHLTVSPVPEILAVMAKIERAVTVAELITKLSAQYDLGDPVEAERSVGRHVLELAALGLVRTA